MTDRVRVLVVEDEKLMQRAFVAALEQAGYEVLTASTGQEAIDIATRERPAVVLLDHSLPDVSGQEVLARLRSDPRTDGAVILIVSGDARLERKLQGLGGGANDYLGKPVDLRELVARIQGQLTARDRWLVRLNEAMSGRLRLARALVGVDATQPLAGVLADLDRVLDAELGIRELALRPFGRHGLAPAIDSRGREGASVIASPAAGALEAPWLERAPGRSVVHLPLQTASTTLAVLSVVPRGEPEPVLAALVDLAAQLSVTLRPVVDAAVMTASDRQWADRLLEPGGMWPVFQPIVSLTDGEVVGFEGLTRFVDGMRPDLGFALAARLGLGATFEIEAAKRILAAAEELPLDAWVSLNVSAATLLSVDLGPVVSESSRRLVLEITEHESVTDYAGVISAVDRLGDVGLSVDDAGSGYASLRHVYELRPSMVKLDRAWVTDIDRDPVRQALVGGLLAFTTATGASLVGEGIERVEERDVLAELGVPLGQGFLFGRPATLDASRVAGGVS
ncbi:MAG: EAL domain-containing protein [Egibacteraceae bacterium]